MLEDDRTQVTMGDARDGQATVLFVHGALHGAWCWDKVISELGKHGVPSRAVDLPSAGADQAALGDLFDDVHVVRAAMADIDGPIVLCGHSYGGTVITAAAAGSTKVRHLVYLAAPIPDAHESVGDILRAAPPDLPEYSGGTAHEYQVQVAREVFYNTCTDADIEWALERLAPFQSERSLTQKAGYATWRDIDSTLVFCTEDRGVTSALLSIVEGRAGRVVTMPTDHSPFLCRPELVANLLLELV